MLLVGLTGNFGMGKSSVLSAFRDLGALTLSSDAIVAGLLEEEAVKRKIRRLLGKAVIRDDNSLDKKLIASKIFNNSELREELEAILHPLVLKRVDAFVKKVKKSKGLVIVEVPLLFEGGYQGRFDKVITVYTSKKNAIERLKGAGFSRSEALQRLNAQLPVSIKKKLADYKVNNNGTKSQTIEQVADIYRIMSDEQKKA